MDTLEMIKRAGEEHNRKVREKIKARELELDRTADFLIFMEELGIPVYLG